MPNFPLKYMYTAWLGILPTKYLNCPHNIQISLPNSTKSICKTKFYNKQQLYLISICVIKRFSICNIVCHIILKKFNLLKKNLAVQLLHNLTPLACTHRGSRNQVFKRLCLVTTTIKHLQKISASHRLTWRFYRGALYRGSSCTNNTKDLPICSAIQIT